MFVKPNFKLMKLLKRHLENLFSPQRTFYIQVNIKVISVRADESDDDEYQTHEGSLVVILYLAFYSRTGYYR